MKAGFCGSVPAFAIAWGPIEDAGYLAERQEVVVEPVAPDVLAGREVGRPGRPTVASYLDCVVV